MKKLDWPLMQNNITPQDRTAAASFILNTDQLTNGAQVRAFEEEFAAWLGCKYAVMVNSGSSANIITMQALAQNNPMAMHPIICMPCITWVSDVAAVIKTQGLSLTWADIDPCTLGIDTKTAYTKRGKGLIPNVVFTTHCLGFDSDPVLTQGISQCLLIEDCCESLGAMRGGKKLGTFGLASNFSFYYAHHMSTIEGGMICTDDFDFYQTCRRLRSHGLVREMIGGNHKTAIEITHGDLDPNFIFAELGFNMRSTEINAVIGREQLKRVDGNNARRTANLLTFLGRIRADRYRTNYRTEGSSNYALPLILKEPDSTLMADVLALLHKLNVEFRRGTAGGGNQLRQPYARKLWGNDFHKQFPQAEHVHQFGLYIGNFPDLESWKIEALCEELNKL